MKTAAPIVLLLLLLSCSSPIPCELCVKPIPPGREVVLTRDGGAHNYRCIHCAFTAAEAAAGDLEIRTRSGGSSQAVVLRRKASAWSAEPSTAVFMILPEEGGECLDRHQSFADEAELRRSVAGRDVKAYTIGQVAEMLAAGRPK